MVTQIDKYSNMCITGITYDYGHHPNSVVSSAKKKSIYNDYTPDGLKQSSHHATSIPQGNGVYRRVSVMDQYIAGLILRSGTPLLWQFDGGYVSLDDNGAPTGWNYYVTDHLGSARMVVGSDKEPWGLLITFQDNRDGKENSNEL